MTWSKVSLSQFPLPLTTSMLKSVLFTSEVIEDVFIHSAELQRDCTSCWNTMQIKHTWSHSKSWPGRGKRQVHNLLQYKVIMANGYSYTCETGNTEVQDSLPEQVPVVG